MTIHCNVTGAERKRLAQVLGEITFAEPEYMKAPTFAYVIGDYHIDKDGTIECSNDVAQEAVLLVVEKLKEQGFEPEIESNDPIGEEDPISEDEPVEDAAPAEAPAEMPDVAPEPETEGMPEAEATEADVGAETPDAAAPEEETSTEADQPEETTTDADDNKLTISIPRAKLTDDALDRLRTIVSNKEELFKRALLADELPIEVAEDKVSFPWFSLTGIAGEAEAYAQFITALCKMAVEQKRVLDKPYDGDNDRFTMRIFMVRLGMKGAEFALARKLMMKHLTGNSGWRYEDSANKSDRSSPNRSAMQHLKKAYPTDTRVELVPMSDESVADIQIGDRGAVIGVDESGSVFIRMDNGSAFGISFCTDEPKADQPDTTETSEPDDSAPFDLPEDADPDIPFDAEPTEEPDAPVTEDEPVEDDPDEDDLPDEDKPDTEEVPE